MFKTWGSNSGCNCVTDLFLHCSITQFVVRYYSFTKGFFFSRFLKNTPEVLKATPRSSKCLSCIVCKYTENCSAWKYQHLPSFSSFCIMVLIALHITYCYWVPWGLRKSSKNNVEWIPCVKSTVFFLPLLAFY